MDNRINVYTCPKGHETITVDKDTGVTPMMLACKTEGCQEMGRSSFYRVPPGLTPTHEWYAPNEEELTLSILEIQLKNPDDGSPNYRMWCQSVEESMRMHVHQGGLLLREIKP